METISQAKAFLRQNFEKGCECPACGQHVKIYKRPLTSAMIHALIIISKAPTDPEGYVHVENYLKSRADVPASVRGDMSKLRYWGLIAPKDAKREDGSSRNGYYKILEAGKKFIKGEISVYSHVMIYNNMFIGFYGEPKNISQIVKKFNYKELIES